jgi:hypothetical protein
LRNPIWLLSAFSYGKHVLSTVRQSRQCERSSKRGSNLIVPHKVTRDCLEPNHQQPRVASHSMHTNSNGEMKSRSAPPSDLKDTDANVPWSCMWLAREGETNGGGQATWAKFGARLVLVQIATSVVERGALVVAGLAKGVAQPFETLVQTVTGCSASRLDVLEVLLV